MICIGGSRGSIGILHEILGNLPSNFEVTIAIALHRHRESNDTLMRLLRSRGMPAIVEPYDKDILSNGAVYLAPPDYHMILDGKSICLSSDPPEHHARPSIDVLFASVAREFGRRSVGVILSGASKDGAFGALQLHNHGGRVIVQNPETAKASTMPKAAIRKVPSAEVMNVAQIIECLQTLLTQEGPVDV
ncbi:chemotaxis protein CheB [uncultured Roseovarius sp.]|uniref:chemotaxis protein CheB n=1 Tax=uncultured Roseovarius sp. TaxID=293344 RepID=UPI00263649F4|nr:chemotaxis protein CheB [uncultured Roseovarius sp.]